MRSYLNMSIRFCAAAFSPFSPAKFGRVALICGLLATTASCVYRQDVQQGNEITRDMIEQVEPGMSKREVIRSLGLPLINDPINRDRWDYFYSLKKGRSKTAEKQSVTLRFSGDTLQSIQIDLPPADETGKDMDQGS